MFLVWKCAVWRRCRSSRSARWPREGSGVAGTAAERGSTPVRRTSLTTNDECTGPNRCDEGGNDLDPAGGCQQGGGDDEAVDHFGTATQQPACGGRDGQLEQHTDGDGAEVGGGGRFGEQQLGQLLAEEQGDLERGELVPADVDGAQIAGGDGAPDQQRETDDRQRHDELSGGTEVVVSFAERDAQPLVGEGVAGQNADDGEQHQGQVLTRRHHSQAIGDPTIVNIAWYGRVSDGPSPDSGPSSVARVRPMVDEVPQRVVVTRTLGDLRTAAVGSGTSAGARSDFESAVARFGESQRVDGRLTSTAVLATIFRRRLGRRPDGVSGLTSLVEGLSSSAAQKVLHFMPADTDEHLVIVAEPDESAVLGVVLGPAAGPASARDGSASFVDRLIDHAATLDEPVAALRAVARGLLDDAVTRDELYARFTAAVERARASGDEVAEDHLHDVMDMIVGWTSPGRQL